MGKPVTTICTFRVHYSHDTVDGVAHSTRDIDAGSPDEAAAALSRAFKPRLVTISKVKRVKQPSAFAQEMTGIAIMCFVFGASMYFALAFRSGAF